MSDIDTQALEIKSRCIHQLNKKIRIQGITEIMNLGNTIKHIQNNTIVSNTIIA